MTRLRAAAAWQANFEEQRTFFVNSGFVIVSPFVIRPSSFFLFRPQGNHGINS
jgi:hypothetical protein